MNINEYSNSELKEMGIPLQCECLSTYREYVEDSTNGQDIYDVCVDCDASLMAGRRAGAW